MLRLRFTQAPLIQTEAGFQAHFPIFSVVCLGASHSEHRVRENRAGTPPPVRGGLSGFHSCSQCLAALWEASLCGSVDQSHCRSSKPSVPIPVLVPKSADLPSFPPKCSVNFGNKSSKHNMSNYRSL